MEEPWRFRGLPVIGPPRLVPGTARAADGNDDRLVACGQAGGHLNIRLRNTHQARGHSEKQHGRGGASEKPCYTTVEFSCPVALALAGPAVPLMAVGESRILDPRWTCT